MNEYISKHDAYTTLKDLEAAYIYPLARSAVQEWTVIQNDKVTGG